jgi:hypothetical protein
LGEIIEFQLEEKSRSMGLFSTKMNMIDCVTIVDQVRTRSNMGVIIHEILKKSEETLVDLHQRRTTNMPRKGRISTMRQREYTLDEEIKKITTRRM